jgi:hypothetical protein
MVLKRKARKATKADLVTPGQGKSQSQPPKSVEKIIIRNGTLVEELTKQEVWHEIIEPLFRERIASVSGRLTNGRYYHGTFTKDWSGETPVMLSGYQKALMDIWNDIHDFIIAKERLLLSKRKESAEKAQVVVNPFMEDLDEQD